MRAEHRVVAVEVYVVGPIERERGTGSHLVYGTVGVVCLLVGYYVWSHPLYSSSSCSFEFWVIVRAFTC